MPPIPEGYDAANPPPAVSCFVVCHYCFFLPSSLCVSDFSKFQGYGRAFLLEIARAAAPNPAAAIVSSAA